MMGETTEHTRIATPSDRETRFERTFEAPVASVWRSFTEPDLVARWWGRGNPLTVERMELIRGGHWRFVEHAPEGDEGFEGRYREVVPEERLVLTFEWDGEPGHVSVTTAEFESLAQDRTRLVETSLFLTTEERDEMLGSGMEEGLLQSLAALDKVLSSLRESTTPRRREDGARR
jgi:uncharacterized protein YndB with AHSA1/START domain